MSATTEIPTKPYLIRALYEWCVDSGHTPYLAVTVDARTRVPMEFVKDGEIVLNVAGSAVHKLAMGNDTIEFSARFNGVSRDISIPVAAVAGIYARETGQGMAFEIEQQSTAADGAAGADGKNDAGAATKTSARDPSDGADKDDTPPPPSSAPGKRPKLQIVK